MQAINFYTTSGMNPHTGYGKLEIGLLRGLQAIGVAVNPFGPMSWDTLRLMSESDRFELVAHLPSTSWPTIITGLPQNGDYASGGERWFYGMSESTQVSHGWVQDLNDLYTGVFVPCPELVTIYRDCGVTVPVFNIGMGNDYHVPPPRLGFKRWDGNGEFIFLTYSYGDMRKGAHLALLAFKSLFHDQPNMKLWIKARGARQTWLAGCQDEQVTVFHDAMSEAEWLTMLRRANAFVFPSYGEGYGLPPREATMAGTPTIATQWLGLHDVDQWGYPVKVGRMLPAQFDFYEANGQDGQWAEPDLDDLKRQMLAIVTDYTRATYRAFKGRQYLLQQTWAKTAGLMMEVIATYGTHSAAA